MKMRAGDIFEGYFSKDIGEDIKAKEGAAGGGGDEEESTEIALKDNMNSKDVMEALSTIQASQNKFQREQRQKLDDIAAEQARIIKLLEAKLR